MKDKTNNFLKEARDLAKVNPSRSYELAKKALEIAISKNFVLDIAEAYFSLAYACRVMSDYIKGLDYALKALEIYEKEEDKLGIIKIKNMIGIIYFYYGDYSSALEHYNKAYELFEFLSDPNMKSSVLNNIGEIYRQAESYELALEYYEKALEVSLKFNLDSNSSILYLNVAEMHYIKKSYDQALEVTKKASEISCKNKDAIAMALVESVLGRLEVVKMNYKQAQAHYIGALKELKKVNNLYYTVEIIIYFSELDLLMQKSPIKHLTEALNLALEIGSDAKVSILYKQFSSYYESKGDFKKALKYWKSFHLKEKELDLQNLSKKLEVLSLEFRYHKEQSSSDKILAVSEKFKREVLETKEEIKRIKDENAKLLEVSIIDELTQIYNRRGISKLLEEKMVETSGYYNLLMILDIDFFKHYNDTWGHVKGDECLKVITSSLKNLNYKDYFIGRYGGEEFLCYAKVKSFESAVEIGEKLCRIVKNLLIPYDDIADSKTITMSLGGVINIHNYTIDACIEKADHNLYKVKETGRNRSQITS